MKKLKITCEGMEVDGRNIIDEIVFNKDKFISICCIKSINDKFIISLQLESKNILFPERSSLEEVNGVRDNILESIFNDKHDFINIVFATSKKVTGE